MRQQNFATFVADPENLPMIENFQARYLLNNALNLRVLRDRLDPDPAKQNRLATATEEARSLYDPVYVREIAHRHFDLLDAVGTTEELNGFLGRIALARGWPNTLGPEAPRVNVAPRIWGASSVIDEITQDAVGRLTRIDRELFERAQAAGQHERSEASPTVSPDHG